EFRVLRDRLFALGGADVETAAAESLDVEISDEPLAGWLAARSGRLLGVHVTGTVAHGSGDAWSIAISDGEGAVTRDLAQVSGEEERALAAWLADADAPKALHEAKDAWHRLDGRGLPLAGVAFDTAIAAYLCR